MENLFNNDEFFNLYISTIEPLDSMNHRNKIYYNILYLWLKNQLNNKSIEAYLLQNKIKTVAIYGAGNLGELLYDELKNSNKIIIKYIIDQSNANKNFYKIPVIKTEHIRNIEDVDCIIVTPIYAFDVIAENLRRFKFKNIVCIDDIIIKIYNK